MSERVREREASSGLVEQVGERGVGAQKELRRARELRRETEEAACAVEGKYVAIIGELKIYTLHIVGSVRCV